MYRPDGVPKGVASCSSARRVPTRTMWFAGWRLAASMAILALVSGCLPIPDVRYGVPAAGVEYRVGPERVRTTFERIPGFEAPGTPVELNQTYVLRYHLDEDVDTVMVLMPGIFGGATSFDPLARQLVAAREGLEVWAIDRRANALEDREGFRRAIAARDPDAAVAYYLGAGGTEPEFVAVDPAAVSFMAEWGLEVHLRDLDAVVQLAGSRAERVVLGGHSLGAALVSLYASYRGVADADAGEELLTGLVLLDGTLGRTGAYRTGVLAPGVFGLSALPDSADVAAGRFPPFLDQFFPPAYYARRGVIAQLGYYRPDADAPGELTSIPMSNRALAGTGFDDDYTVPFFAPSLGTAVDAVYHGNLPAFVVAGRYGARSRSVAAVAPGADRVEWSAGDPATEHTDLRGFLRAWAHPSADYNEWYFPLRLGLEIAELDARLADRPEFRPTSEVTLPTIGFGAERGLVADQRGFATYVNLRFGSPVVAYVVPGFTHVDVLSAAANPVVPVLIRWLELLRAADR